MPISVPERGSSLVNRDQWVAISSSDDFWRLVEHDIIKPEAAGSGRFRLRGSCHVGRAEIAGTIIEVTEKFPGAFRTLATAGAHKAPKLLKVASPVAPSEGSTAVLVTLFLDAARTYLSGWKRVAYTSVNDAGALIGGRLDIARTAHFRAKGLRHRAAFKRTVLTTNLPINQLIFAALREIERLSKLTLISHKAVATARALRLGLDECLPAVLSMNAADIERLIAETDAVNERPEVEEAVSLAAAVLDAAGFGGGLSYSRTISRSWFINLENFFEDALRRIVKAAIAGSGEVTGPTKRPRLFTGGVATYRANPDIVIRMNDGTRAIADAKYKDYEKWPSAADVHELISHAAAYEASKAFLLFPAIGGFRAQYFGKSNIGCEVWGIALDFDDLEGSVFRALAEVGLKFDN